MQLLEREPGSGQNAHLQRWAADTLPAVLDYLRQVQEALARTSGAPSQGLDLATSGSER